MRERATVLCVKDGMFLAVQERGSHTFSLPGGGIYRNEQAISAAVRELYEETGLRLQSIQHFIDFAGSVQYHHVFIAVPSPGKIKKQRSEIKEAVWFPLDTRMDNFQGHLIKVLREYRKSEFGGAGI